MDYLDIANYFLGEDFQNSPSGSVNPVANVGTLRNDYASVFPHAFTGDATTLSEKELQATIDTVAECNDLRHLLGHQKELQDNIQTLKTLGQNNRINDLEVRLFIVEKAIAIKNMRAPHLEN